MKKLKLIIVFMLLFVAGAYSQRKIVDFFTTPEGNGKYQFLSAGYSRQYSGNFVGLQYKKLSTLSDIAISVFSGYSVSVNYGTVNQLKMINTNAEAHLMAIPFTIFFRLGVGLNHVFTFNHQSNLSPYGSISLDIGGAEVSYKYIFSKNTNFVSNQKHALSVKLRILKKYTSR